MPLFFLSQPLHFYRAPPFPSIRRPCPLLCSRLLPPSPPRRVEASQGLSPPPPSLLSLPFSPFGGSRNETASVRSRLSSFPSLFPSLFFSPSSPEAPSFPSPCSLSFLPRASDPPSGRVAKNHAPFRSTSSPLEPSSGRRRHFSQEKFALFPFFDFTGPRIRFRFFFCRRHQPFHRSLPLEESAR